MVFCKATKAETLICELCGNKDYASTYMVPNKQQELNKLFRYWSGARDGDWNLERGQA